MLFNQNILAYSFYKIGNCVFIIHSRCVVFWIKTYNKNSWNTLYKVLFWLSNEISTEIVYYSKIRWAINTVTCEARKRCFVCFVLASNVAIGWTRGWGGENWWWWWRWWWCGGGGGGVSLLFVGHYTHELNGTKHGCYEWRWISS